MSISLAAETTNALAILTKTLHVERPVNRPSTVDLNYVIVQTMMPKYEGSPGSDR